MWSEIWTRGSIMCIWGAFGFLISLRAFGVFQCTCLKIAINMKTACLGGKDLNWDSVTLVVNIHGVKFTL